MKKILVAVLILVIAVFSLTGCQTAKGTGLNNEHPVQAAANPWDALMNLDQWIRKNIF